MPSALPFRSAPPPLALACATTALVALALPAWVVTHPPALPSPARVVSLPHRIVPPAELPPVEPTRFQDLPPDEARAWNAAVPFVTGPSPAARPFRLTGAPEDQARAIDCMAAAMLYEAGDDPVGERAVGQVVINRSRHPAFPKTICGVVFQGQERRTGCQFTFTCDGALDRPPDPDRWARAQGLARDALTGAVVRKVGYATHYHTDWVVPYWSASLDKVAEVHTHLFFRWTGWWGTPPAFRRQVDAREPVIAKLASISVAHGLQAALDEAAAATLAADTVLATQPGAGQPLAADGTFLVTLDRKLTADQMPFWATAACGVRDYCKLLAWTDRKETPKALPATPEQMVAMAFSYLRDKPKGFDKPLWNCLKFRRPDPRQCMKTQLPVAAPVALPSPTPRPTTTPMSQSSAAPRAILTPTHAKSPSTPPAASLRTGSSRGPASSSSQQQKEKRESGSSPG